MLELPLLRVSVSFQNVSRAQQSWWRVLYSQMVVYVTFSYFCVKDQGIIELLLLFTIWFISSLKEIKVKKILPDWDSHWGPSAPQPSTLSTELQPHLFNLRMSKTMPQTLDQYWSTLVCNCPQVCGYTGWSQTLSFNPYHMDKLSPLMAFFQASS